MSQRYLGGVITANPTAPTMTTESGVWTLEQQFQYSSTWSPKIVGNSVRLRSSASAYFSRTPASAGNRKTWTWSGWAKIDALSAFRLFAARVDDNNRFIFSYAGSTQFNLQVSNVVSGTSTVWAATSALLRDPSAWYHFVVAFDSTQATATNRLKVYINGVEQTFSTDNRSSITQNYDGYVNNNIAHYVGTATTAAGNFSEGYLTEINFIDGQALTPSSFGAFDSTGVWQPLPYTGTYGTNGFYLTFADNSAATAAALGKDYSGNGNNWTPNNISLTAGTTYDWMLDSPTTSAVSSNYCVLNPLDKSFSSSTAILNGNLRFSDSTSTAGADTVSSTMFVSTGKWYWEATITAVGSTAVARVGITKIPVYNQGSSNGLGAVNGQLGYFPSGNKQVDGASASAYGASYTTGDVIGVALDCDGGTITFYKNNTSQGAITYSSGSGAAPAFGGVDGYGAIIDANFGQRPFAYTPPTGFKALNTLNLPDPTILNGAQVMAATTYTGNASTQTITNGGNNTIGTTFKPDLVWAKSRSNAYYGALVDSVRGVDKYLYSALTIAEETQTTALSSFNSNGFSLNGSFGNVNASGATYVAWQWQAGQGTTSSNTSGSITSTVSVNATAGFSVVAYNSGASGDKTVGHGLGVAPSMIITKSRSSASYNWSIYHASVATTVKKYLTFTTGALQDNGINIWGSAFPTSSVFGITSGNGVVASTDCIAYCWAAVAGYSAFGSYTGNNSADGPFVYLGFMPRWVMIKGSSVASSWAVFDTSRNTYNVMGSDTLLANSSAASSNYPEIDFVSNGFKVRANDVSSYINGSGQTYIYAAFAENPFKISRAR